MTISAQDPAVAALRLRIALTAMITLLAVALIAERLGYAGVYRGEAAPAALLLQLLLALPSLLYLLALWHLRQVAAAVAAGASFGMTVVRGLRRVGHGLLAGAALSLVATPLLHRALPGRYPRSIDYDVATLIIGAIGLGLVFLARLVDRAAAVQSELDEIF